MAHSNQKNTLDNGKTPEATGGHRTGYKGDEQGNIHPIPYTLDGDTSSEREGEGNVPQEWPTTKDPNHSEGIRLSKPTIITKPTSKQTQRHRYSQNEMKIIIHSFIHSRGEAQVWMLGELHSSKFYLLPC